MTASPACIALIKEFEGCKLEAYEDIAGVWSIGYGHTGDVKPNEVITQESADEMLEQDVARTAFGVSNAVKITVNQNQFDALVSFAFNLGVKALRGSTLLIMVNATNFNGAAAQFLRWDKAGGVEVPGLLRRRQAESYLFSKG